MNEARRRLDVVVSAYSEDQLRTLYEAIPCGVIIRNASGRIVYANEAAGEILGVELDPKRAYRAMPTGPRAREDGSPLPDSETPGLVALRTGRPVRKFTMRVARPDGSQRWLQVDAVLLYGDDRRPSFVVTSFVDITERKLCEFALEERVLHDQLTGLPNRTLLLDRLAQLLLVGSRHGHRLALLFVDLDRFKVVNDTLGHAAGDCLLQEVGRRFTTAVRRGDTVARLGGDEFAILLPLAHPAEATLVARKLCAALEPAVDVGGRALQVRASMGISVAPDDGSDAETLMRHADIAMYAAKRRGVEHIVYTPALDGEGAAKLALEADLRRGIDAGELLLHYQPIVEVRGSRCVALEALVRWDHPERGLLPPSEFLPVAEETGLMPSLTVWVLNDALRQCFRWRRAGLPAVVAVNVSMHGLRPAELVETVTESVRISKVDPAWLRLEITEDFVMSEPELMIEALGLLRTLGVRAAVDDFGTGYSSLSYLQRLPVDQVKIDHSFVGAMRTDAGSEVIVRSAVRLCHDLKRSVVAEGVEDQETLERLAALGCDLAQGYHIAPPMGADEAGAWLRSATSSVFAALRAGTGRFRTESRALKAGVALSGSGVRRAV